MQVFKMHAEGLREFSVNFVMSTILKHLLDYIS